jgi:putative hydrolase of the HAD superfamily
MKYRHLFFDLDHTLWDFEANAYATLVTLHEELRLAERGVDDFGLFYRNYLVHNERLWEQYRKGLIRQDELRVKRMRLALLDFKIADEALSEQMNVRFLDLLPARNLLFPYTIEILQYLQEKGYELHLITNGFEAVQHSKLRHSGLDVFFREVITSESSNSIKPNKEIFEYAFMKAAADPAKSIMIGDTIDVDIQGAMNAGIDQVFVNYHGLESPIKPTYTVSSLKELEQIF